jgi:hypothetical protein
VITIVLKELTAFIFRVKVNQVGKGAGCIEDVRGTDNKIVLFLLKCFVIL